ncbi:hypothetical protein L1987_83819 [Smallanthus sonchifolius]|uniref:Uncharacterized protein n=1 Tax=Smallanthus sonchifolius TaxID=185202 RepID=A0ACB8YE42_9ASTR|nr:hypothetical protein L1987_83819 [Smallanthus sonchifolius]
MVQIFHSQLCVETSRHGNPIKLQTPTIYIFNSFPSISPHDYTLRSTGSLIHSFRLFQSFMRSSLIRLQVFNCYVKIALVITV